jgi:hypothetical protein
MRQDRCEGKRAGAMTNTLTDGNPGFLAGEPKHCHVYYRLIQPDRLPRKLEVLFPPAHAVPSTSLDDAV